MEILHLFLTSMCHLVSMWELMNFEFSWGVEWGELSGVYLSYGCICCGEADEGSPAVGFLLEQGEF